MENEIADLSPLTTLKNLDALDVSSNEISNLDPLAKVPSLSWIGLAFHQRKTAMKAIALFSWILFPRMFLSTTNIMRC